MSAQGSPAWLLTLCCGRSVAVGEYDVVHVMTDVAPRFGVPHAPTYCRDVVLWSERVLPVMDLGVRLGGVSPGTRVEKGYLAVCCYAPGAVEHYGALALKDVPQRILVEDNDACDIPDSARAFGAFALSCFERPELGPVPILDLSAVFAPLPSV